MRGVTLVMVNVALPVLVSTTTSGIEEVVFTNWLRKFTEEVLRETIGEIPVPLRATLSGLLPALVEKVKFAALAPMVSGVKLA